MRNESQNKERKTMTELSVAQVVGAIMGALIAVTVAGIIRMLNGSNDADI